jgi:hypothetical protein
MSDEEKLPFKIKFVKPGDKLKRQPPRNTGTFQHDMSQFYVLKSLFEDIFDHTVYMDLKENSTISDWRKHTKRLLDAIAVSIKSTVKIADQNWRDQMAEIIAEGKERIGETQTPEDMFACLSATLTRIVFLQIGFIPTRGRKNKPTPLASYYWTLNSFRSVQYVQDDEQRAKLDEYLAVLASRRRPLENENPA